MTFQTAAYTEVERLYHYQPYDEERFLQLVECRKIYFSSAKHFNDPWDCKPFYNLDALDDPVTYDRYVERFDAIGRKSAQNLTEEQRQACRDRMRTDRPFFEGIIREFADGIGAQVETDYGVYCLTPHPLSISMWSHYANKHSGICIEFGTDNDDFCSAFKVEYHEAFPNYDLFPDDPEDEVAPFIGKAKAWCYEQEYRLIAAEGDHGVASVLRTQNRRRRFPDNALKSIIIGCLTSPNDEGAIRAAVARHAPDVSVQKAIRDPSRYKLDLQ